MQTFSVIHYRGTTYVDRSFRMCLKKIPLFGDRMLHHYVVTAPTEVAAIREASLRSLSDESFRGNSEYIAEVLRD